MDLKLTHNQGIVPITVLHLEGRMDGSNYEELITMAQQLYEAGTRDLLLDLGKLTFLSSAGLSAIHRTALIFNGKRATELEEGWAAFRAMERDRDSAMKQHVKLLNPNTEVSAILDMVGFNTFFEIYNDIHKAVASFQ